MQLLTYEQVLLVKRKVASLLKIRNTLSTALTFLVAFERVYLFGNVPESMHSSIFDTSFFLHSRLQGSTRGSPNWRRHGDPADKSPGL